jgi:hypothetical protein
VKGIGSEQKDHFSALTVVVWESDTIIRTRVRSPWEKLDAISANTYIAIGFQRNFMLETIRNVHIFSFS